MTTGNGRQNRLASWTLAALTTFMVLVRVSQQWELSQQRPAYQILQHSPSSGKRFHQNDLFPSMEPPQLISIMSISSSSGSGSSSSSSSNNNNNNKLQGDRSGQDSSGGRPVINGNHATYVEPPADFKPIIYEPIAAPSVMHINKKQKQQEASNVIDQIVSGTTSADYSGQSNSNFSSSSKREQQLGLDNDNVAETANNMDELDNGDDSQAVAAAAAAAAAVAQPELKPSIGRWSDWHDMSIEPDLASSDSQQLASAPPPPPADVMQKRNLYTSPLSPTRVAAGLKTTTTKTTKTTRYELLDNSERPAQQMNAGFLPLMNMNPQYYPPANLINLRHSLVNRPQHQQQQQQQQQPFYLMSPASHGALMSSQPLTLSHPHFFLARSQFELMQSPSPFLLSGNKNNLFISGALQAPLSSKGHRQQQQQQQQASPLPLFRKRSKNAEVVRVNSSKQMTQRPASSEHQVSAPLMNSPAPPAQPKRPALLGERVFVLSGQKVATNQKAPTTTTGSNNSTSIKRVLKRRRIKTLLPVGLSSWMLGGIRDLDARHWKLPADVISKLAVNDVDLAHPTTTTTTTTTTGDDSTTNNSALEQAGPPLISGSSTQSVPNSQLIPR